MPAVLFVCLGNICRSPLAEGTFRQRVSDAGLSDRFIIDSAGTGGWHAGDPPDRRSIAAAARRGVDISDQRARKIVKADFTRFDLILGMDRQNVADLTSLGTAHRDRIARYRDYALGRTEDIPDPYYDGDAAFDLVFDLCDEAAQALLSRLIDRI